MKEPYEVLGLQKNASLEMVKKAYISLQKKYHPDVFQGDKVFASQMTAEINIAYTAIKKEIEEKNKKPFVRASAIKPTTHARTETKPSNKASSTVTAPKRDGDDRYYFTKKFEQILKERNEEMQSEQAGVKKGSNVGGTSHNSVKGKNEQTKNGVNSAAKTNEELLKQQKLREEFEKQKLNKEKAEREKLLARQQAERERQNNKYRRSSLMEENRIKRENERQAKFADFKQKADKAAAEAKRLKKEEEKIDSQKSAEKNVEVKPTYELMKSNTKRKVIETPEYKDSKKFTNLIFAIGVVLALLVFMLFISF